MRSYGVLIGCDQHPLTELVIGGCAAQASILDNASCMQDHPRSPTGPLFYVREQVTLCETYCSALSLLADYPYLSNIVL